MIRKEQNCPTDEQFQFYSCHIPKNGKYFVLEIEKN